MSAAVMDKHDIVDELRGRLTYYRQFDDVNDPSDDPRMKDIKKLYMIELGIDERAIAEVEALRAECGRLRDGAYRPRGCVCPADAPAQCQSPICPRAGYENGW